MAEKLNAQILEVQGHLRVASGAGLPYAAFQHRARWTRLVEPTVDGQIDPASRLRRDLPAATTLDERW